AHNAIPDLLWFRVRNAPAGVGPLNAGDQLKMTLKGATQDFVWETFVKA
ncbi:hypothetical protein ACFMJX_29955, partial [Acinetobacter baumannii]